MDHLLIGLATRLGQGPFVADRTGSYHLRIDGQSVLLLRQGDDLLLESPLEHAPLDPQRDQQGLLRALLSRVASWSRRYPQAIVLDVVLEHARQAHVHGVVVAAAFGRAVQGEVLDRRHDAVRGGQIGALVGTDHHAGQQRGQVGVFAEAFRDPPPARVAGDVDHRREAHVEPVGAGFEGGDPRAAGDHLGVPAGGQAEADGKDGAVPVGHVVGMEQRDLQAAMADLVLHGANVRAGHGIEYGADLAGADIRHQRFLGMVGADADQA